MAFLKRTALDPGVREMVGKGRVLASGRSDAGQVVGLVDRMVYADGGGTRELRWQDVDRGHWDDELKVLRWTDVQGNDVTLTLIEAGRIPDLFNERVDASIACVRTVELGPQGKALTTARRDLGDPTAPLIWRVASQGGDAATADNPLVALTLERLRDEYDLG
jgi:hypothetical protein